MLGTATLSVPLGVFGHGSRKNPTNAKLLTISARRFKRVDVTAVRDRWLPTAVAFRRLWEITTGRTSLYVWTPVAPEGFTAIGLGVSTTPEPPALDSVRCLPNAWVVPGWDHDAKLQKFWEDDGENSELPVTFHLRLPPQPQPPPPAQPSASTAGSSAATKRKREAKDYTKEIEQLRVMGFTHEKEVMQALVNAEGDVNVAVQLLT